MTKRFTGLFTALITPFTEKEAIDYAALEMLVDEQLQANVNGLVVLGTTGESPTINANEREELIKFIIKKVDGKIDVIIGTGSNSTTDTINKSQQAEKLGADGLLIVNPYYNKPTQNGLLQHFSTIADSTTLPIILYNIKGRTCVNLETETLLKLSEHKNIVAVKEASGDMNQIMSVIKKTPSDFSVLSGDDALIYSLMTLGGDGVVSVLSNLLPTEMKKMVALALASDFAGTLKLHNKLYNLMHGALSIGTNPMAIKTALALQGKISESFRLPLCPLTSAQKIQLEKILEAYYHN